MLNLGRIKMTSKEQEGVERLLERQGAHEKVISMTRAEPDEKGPVHVEIEGKFWRIDKTGRATKRSEN